MTPRQMSALMFIADKRTAREKSADLQISALAARGKPDDIKNAARRLSE